ncbi:MAG: phage baseplate assembly protein V [Pseudomonadota bacterium]
MQDLVSVVRAIVRSELEARPQSGLGRVEAVQVPDAAGLNQYACDVALQDSQAIYEKVPLSTSYLGQLAPPAVGDVVVVQFAMGDPDNPIITGFVFSEAVSAPEVAEGERLVIVPHEAGESDRIEMRQTAGTNGSRVWKVSLPSGPELTITDAAITAQIGDFLMQIDQDGGKATVSSGGATVALDGSGEVSIAGDTDINIEAGANLAIKASGNATIEASGTMALKAAKIDLN